MVAKVQDYLSFDHMEVTNEDFSNRKIRQFVSTNSTFRKCRFEKIKVEQACFGAGLYDSFYFDCIFDGSKITASAPGHARFERCSFRNIILQKFFNPLSHLP